MINWQSIKPLYQERILTLSREYSSFIREMKQHHDVVQDLTQHIMEKAQELQVITKDKEVDVRQKYILLDNLAKEMEHIAEKRDAICEQANGLSKKIEQQTTVLYDVYREEYPQHTREELVELLHSKIKP